MKEGRQAPYQTLGQCLEAASREAGYSVRQLAALSGVPKSSVDRLLRDEVGHPQAEHIIALARALELNAADLFLLAGVPVPDEAASMHIMLRKGYGVSDEEIPELKREIEELIAKHKPDEPRKEVDRPKS